MTIRNHDAVGHLGDNRRLLGGFTLSGLTRFRGGKRDGDISGDRSQDALFVLAEGGDARADRGDHAQRALVGD